MAPAILDRQAQGYVDPNKIKFRYTANSIITVYTSKVDSIRETMKKLVQLGKQGIAIGGQDHQTRIEYLFTKLNEIKPEMVEEATKKAREVAEKFAVRGIPMTVINNKKSYYGALDYGEYIDQIIRLA